MRKTLKKIARQFGLEISRNSAFSSSPGQVVKALEMANINLLFDVGSNEGQFACEIRDFGYSGRIVSFEPVTSAWKALSNLAGSDLGWIVAERCAIGERHGEIEINIAGNSVSSSILPMLEAHSRASVESSYVEKELAPIFKLDSIAGRYTHTETNVFIKIDTQGYEWQVLDGASETLRHTRGLLCELSLVPLYRGQRLWRDIVDRLEAEGFFLWGIQKGFTDPLTGQSLQMDGIFLRRP